MPKPRGHPPIPDEVKIFEGTYRPDQSGPIETHVLAEGVPVPPKRLKGEALKFWKQVVPGLIEMGVAREMDAPALAIMCEWYARYLTFSKQLDKIADDEAAQNVACVLNMVNKAGDAFDCMASKFGMSPVDRARLRVEPKKKEGVWSRKREQEA